MAIVWWRFRRHHLAMLGAFVLAIMVFIALFAEFLAPVATESRDTGYVSGPPQAIHFFDAEGRFHIVPFVYGTKSARDPFTFKMIVEPDLETIQHLRLFVHANPIASGV